MALGKQQGFIRTKGDFNLIEI